MSSEFALRRIEAKQGLETLSSLVIARSKSSAQASIEDHLPPLDPGIPLAFITSFTVPSAA
jgi:hypothetical protein